MWSDLKLGNSFVYLGGYVKVVGSAFDNLSQFATVPFCFFRKWVNLFAQGCSEQILSVPGKSEFRC